MRVNRREFLASLAALGAAMVLPDKATSAQVDEAWAQALREPWFFEVNDSGTIVEPDGQEPKIRSDIYDDLWLGHPTTPDSLIRGVDEHEELRSHFQSLGADERDDIESQLDDDDDEEVNGAGRERLLALRAALRDEDDGWRAWVRLEGEKGLPRFEREIDKWLAEPVDWFYSEFWPEGWSSQGKALLFFQQLGASVLRELDIKIIEGEHPGSTYHAAELRMPVAQANEVARQLGLPFRFREEQS
jgi:hypothetical protein